MCHNILRVPIIESVDSISRVIINGARYVTMAGMTKSSAWKWSLLWIGTSTRDQQL